MYAWVMSHMDVIQNVTLIGLGLEVTHLYYLIRTRT